ncbi:MAG: hypothetical protein KF829_03220 [Ferruginibacter sp.]|nr:hypothetical protein [Ferruginibacter sp.]
MQWLEINLQDIQAAISFVSMIAFLWLLIEFKGMKDAIKEKTGISNEGLRLKMQAYERMSLYAERAGLKNLVGRLPLTGEPALVAHERMVTELRSEYEYNISQQVYVSPEVWNAVTKLRDQNIYIINQLYAGLPQNASDADLGKRILEYSLNHNAELNNIVLDALQFEAKQTLKTA